LRHVSRVDTFLQLVAAQITTYITAKTIMASPYHCRAFRPSDLDELYRLDEDMAFELMKDRK